MHSAPAPNGSPTERVQAERIALLEERIAQLEAELGMHAALPAHLGFTATEDKIVGMLLKRDLAFKAALYTTIYGMHDNPPEPKILDVLVTRIRKKLSPHGIMVSTAWGRGWYLDPDSRAKLKAIVDAHQNEAMA